MATIEDVMKAAHQYAIRFPSFARGETTAREIDEANQHLEEVVRAAIAAARISERAVCLQSKCMRPDSP